MNAISRISALFLFTVLMAASVSLPAISGKVTDTNGVIPIADAVVRLEKDGHTATTGSDGLFTLNVVSTTVLHGKSTSLPNGLSAGITGNLMIVTIAEPSAVEVATFDCNGKSLLTVRKTLDAGNHSLSIPYQGAGLHLYKVKSGKREILLKGNTLGGVSYGSVFLSQGPSSNPLAKPVRSTAAINDVIAVTKTGYLNCRVAVRNSDTSEIRIKMISQDAGTLTDVDSNVYHTVRIGNQVWTVENLRVTKYRDGIEVPLDTSKTKWKSSTSGKYCYFKNTTNADSIKKYGALYNWYVVSSKNPKKIAPEGWHVPSDAEWDTLQNYLIAKGYNYDGTDSANKIAKSLAVKTDWSTYSDVGTVGCDLTKNNTSGFSALPAGYRYADGSFQDLSYLGSWWCSTEFNAALAYYRTLSYRFDYLGRYYDVFKSCGNSVRLLRD